MLSCQQASALVSISLQRQLTRKERWSLRLHLAICKACRRFKQQCTVIQSMLTTWLVQTEQDTTHRLSAEARSRIQQMIASSEHD